MTRMQFCECPCQNLCSLPSRRSGVPELNTRWSAALRSVTWRSWLDIRFRHERMRAE